MNHTISYTSLKNNDTETEFILYKSYDLVDGVVSGNPDTINITYELKTFMFQGLWYKTTLNIKLSLLTDTDPWMISSEILITEITNENDIHVKILH